MSVEFDLLKQAILERRPVHAIYDGLERWLCPHRLGYKKGAENVLCYQYAGFTSTGQVDTPPVPGDGPSDLWKCMKVAGLSGLRLLDAGPWYTCQKHTQRATCVDQVIADVGAG